MMIVARCFVSMIRTYGWWMKLDMGFEIWREPMLSKKQSIWNVDEGVVRLNGLTIPTSESAFNILDINPQDIEIEDNMNSRILAQWVKT